MKCLLGLVILIGVLEVMMVVRHPLLQYIYHGQSAGDTLSVINKAMEVVEILAWYHQSIKAGRNIMNKYYDQESLKLHEEWYRLTLQAALKERPNSSQHSHPRDHLQKVTPLTATPASEQFDGPITRSRARAQRIADSRGWLNHPAKTT